MIKLSSQVISPELAQLLDARDRVERALAAQAECLRKLKALDVCDREALTVRRPTLLGVAPQGGTGDWHGHAFQRAARIGRRPSGRY
jgi:hypothetical protein